MIKIALTILAVAQVGFCQYSSNTGTTMASGVTSGTGPAATTMNGGNSGATTGSSATGDCTSATDSVYLAQLKVLAGIEGELAATLAANPTAKTDNSSGFFLGVIISAGQENQVLSNISAGQAVSGAQCLSANQMLGNTIAQTIAHANDVVPQPLTGENKYQDMLQRLGKSLNILLASSTQCKSYSSNAGPWLTVILNLATNIQAIQTVVSNNDSSNNCLTASKALASSLQSILSSANAQG